VDRNIERPVDFRYEYQTCSTACREISKEFQPVSVPVDLGTAYVCHAAIKDANEVVRKALTHSMNLRGIYTAVVSKYASLHGNKAVIYRRSLVLGRRGTQLEDLAEVGCMQKTGAMNSQH